MSAATLSLFHTNSVQNLNLTWQNSRLASRIPELDGIRGLAVLIVVLHHYIIPSTVGVTGRWAVNAVKMASLTWTVVDMFFVMSGFLVAGILLDSKGGPQYFKTFYLRRMYRILPIYAVWLFLFAIGLYLIHPAPGSPLFGVFGSKLPLWSYASFTQNLAMAYFRDAGVAWLGISWSLAVEEQFYALLPFCVLLRRRTLIVLACAAIIAGPLVRLAMFPSGNYIGIYVLLVSRADSFALGVVAAALVRRREVWLWLNEHRNNLYHALLFVFVTGAAILTLSPRVVKISIGYSLIAICYFLVLLLLVVNPRQGERRFFQNRILQYLGAISFGVYLMHEGISHLLHALIFAATPSILNMGALAVTLLAFSLSLSAAALSWKYFEKPLMRFARRKYTYDIA